MRHALWVTVLASCVAARAADKEKVLKNQHIEARFDGSGLVRITDLKTGRALGLQGDRFALAVDDVAFDSAAAQPETAAQEGPTVTYRYKAAGLNVAAVYELKPGWRFVTKHLRVEPTATHRVKALTVLDATLDSAVAHHLLLRGSHYHPTPGSYGSFLRFDDKSGLLACLQNPFNQTTVDVPSRRLTLAYAPEMDWDKAWGPFESDRACLVPTALSGTRFPERMLPEWEYVQKPGEYGRDLNWIDVNEMEAFADCVYAFSTYRPKNSVRLHVEWCENSYQLDLAKPEHWEEYKRILKMARAVGCDHVLYSPTDTSLATMQENRDAWQWEQVLWINMGQKIRKGEWVAGRDALPARVREHLDFAKENGVRLVAYAYPTLGWSQDESWCKWWGPKGDPNRVPRGYRGADTGKRSFQDWLVKTMITYKQQAGLGGYALDHWWIAYDDVDSSKYTQWYGARRILQELRRADPDIVVDTRQQVHNFGPWTWIGGSWPHPMASDEQPGSFRAFPDLHFSRVSADRTRNRNFWYRVHMMCPVSIVPGFTTHQTMRSDKKGVMRRDPYRRADWDFLGWKYSVISSIGTAPVNHVVNYLPARSIEEYEQFPEEHKAWFRDWFDWTDRNFDVLQRLRPIIGQPMLGRCDGTAAVDGDRGFVFLFNPNYRALDASFALDASIGVTKGSRFVFRQLYPDLGKGRLLGHPRKGAWELGETVTLPMSGASALVLELVPAETLSTPALLNAAGRAGLADGTLNLTEVEGEIGTEASAAVLLGKGDEVKALTVNGEAAPFKQDGSVATASIAFPGTPFGKCRQVGAYDPDFSGTNFTGKFSVPKRVLDQLAARRKVWNISYPEEEVLATWSAPWRNLLFICIADPKHDMKVEARLDGNPLEVKGANSSVLPFGHQRTFVGFYVDLTGALEPEREYKLEVNLPAGLQPGQFQGVFFDGVEPEYTAAVAPEN